MDSLLFVAVSFQQLYQNTVGAAGEMFLTSIIERRACNKNGLSRKLLESRYQHNMEAFVYI